MYEHCCPACHPYQGWTLLLTDWHMYFKWSKWLDLSPGHLLSFLLHSSERQMAFHTLVTFLHSHFWALCCMETCTRSVLVGVIMTINYTIHQTVHKLKLLNKAKQLDCHHITYYKSYVTHLLHNSIQRKTLGLVFIRPYWMVVSIMET